MKASFQRLFCGICLLTVPLAAGGVPFVPPAEENPPFRRDRLPIDTDSMASLSGNLTLLTRADSLETAGQRRAAAQALALALALDPSNSKARDDLSSLAAGRRLSQPDDRKLALAKARTWRTLAWLSVPEAGADGNTLGVLLADAVSVLDRDHPEADELREKPQQEAWDDWVAPLSDFEEKEEPAKEDMLSDSGDNDSKPPDHAKKPAAIILEKASLSTVLQTYDKKSRMWTPEKTVVTMESSAEPQEGEDSGGLVIRIPGPEEQGWLIEENVATPIKDALSGFLGTIPGQGEINLLAGPDGSYIFKKNQAALTGPGFILGHAALSGSEPEGIVIAELDGKNRMVLPDHFWRALQALTEEKRGKLVVPAAAEEYLVSFLAMEKPGFFLKYEVLLASTHEEFVALCAKDLSGANASAATKFAEVVEKSAGTAIGSYLANRFVRQRLQEIIDEAPNHLSAKLLARQGAGMRPQYLSRKVLAAEIWRTVDVIGELGRLDFMDLSESQLDRLDELYEEMRERLVVLERYADIRDRELLKEGRDLTLTVRNLSRALRSRGDYDVKLMKIGTAYREMTSDYHAFCAKLSQISGDPLRKNPEE